jgi:hypothetical protein
VLAREIGVDDPLRAGLGDRTRLAPPFSAAAPYLKAQRNTPLTIS